MIITKTPYRISYFGGGSDYPGYFNEHGGAVLACAINKYCFITYRHLPPFFPHKHRIVYSAVEHVLNLQEIKHSGVRECLKFTNTIDGIEVHHDGDLPARSGTGSSSAFVVGLLHAIATYRQQPITSQILAEEAIHIERTVINDAGGWQDQIITAFGGFKHIEFKSNKFSVSDMSETISQDRISELMSHTMLVFTGNIRDASSIAASYNVNQSTNLNEIRRTKEMVDEAIKILTSKADLKAFGQMLDESWHLKKRRGSGVTTPDVDKLYDFAKKSGCLGGKLIGAGGAGFMLLLIAPEDRSRIEKELLDANYLNIPIDLERNGSQVIYNDETNHAAKYHEPR